MGEGRKHKGDVADDGQRSVVSRRRVGVSERMSSAARPRGAPSSGWTSRGTVEGGCGCEAK